MHRPTTRGPGVGSRHIGAAADQVADQLHQTCRPRPVVPGRPRAKCSPRPRAHVQPTVHQRQWTRGHRPRRGDDRCRWCFRAESATWPPPPTRAPASPRRAVTDQQAKNRLDSVVTQWSFIIAGGRRRPLNRRLRKDHRLDERSMMSLVQEFRWPRLCPGGANELTRTPAECPQPG